MSRLPFELLLALRYLRPKRTFVSVITLISVLGVTLGVAVLIIVISVMSGFDRQLRDRILGFNTHMRIMGVDGSVTNYKEISQKVSAYPAVKAVAPFVLGRVMVETEPDQGKPRVDAPWIRGLDASLETNMSILPQSIVSGAFDVQNRGLLIGSDFADNMRLSVGDRVNIYSPEELKKMKDRRGATNEVDIIPDEYEVRGIFHVGYYEYDVSFVVTDLEDAQNLWLLGTNVHGLLVVLKEPYDAPRVQKELRKTLGSDFSITTWMQENASLLNALIVEKNVMFYLLFFIMIVAALCILSALITFVVQKTREIGMLKALGATDWQVSLIFLSQGALVGALGDLAGYGLGMLALAYRNEFLHFMNRATGFELFPASIYGFGELPAIIIAKDIWLICGSAWLICTLGGIIPAWRAGRLTPVEALRYE
jgi:lipoprotein-releasing system permease protein